MKLKSEFLIREFNGTVYAVPSGLSQDNKSEPIILNATARILWQLLCNDVTKAEMTEAILSRYEVEESVVAADVDAFVDEMQKADLLVQ